MIFRSDFESDDAENDESKGMKQGAAVGNQAIITIVPDVATHTQLSPKENSRSEPPEQGYWATVPFLDRDTRKTKNDQGLVTGCGDTPDTLKMQFQDGSTWPVPRSAILRFSKRRREEAAQSDGKSNNSHKPVASGQSRARAGGSALAAGVERINWRAKLRQRCIVEVPNPAYGSYGKAPRYENGDELSDEDLQWWWWNKPRSGEEGRGESRLDGDYCEVCGEGAVDGNLMVCEGPTAQGASCGDGQMRAFHPQCLPRPLARPPTGHWMCELCRPASGQALSGRASARVVCDEATDYVCRLFGIASFDGAPPVSRRPRFTKSDLPKDYRLGL
eukprot:CAMPEP_0172151674 /NCGR_PEP_ID=MMETSP1050-20130122/366_1 /TAXON_ID=233186 /ORGANISM="Cryptomonas curvata, Strain CCAP979/52" /LENGTH=331 /DNA_ID=CAMNT_0012819817 /DNA_START=399 /DNA_END=1391 /DNA_ORIENTATION=+